MTEKNHRFVGVLGGIPGIAARPKAQPSGDHLRPCRVIRVTNLNSVSQRQTASSGDRVIARSAASAQRAGKRGDTMPMEPGWS